MLSDEAVWALGAMSGTSLDGVDAAMLLSDGVDILEFGASGFRAFSGDEQKILRTAMGGWQPEEHVAELVETAHAELLSTFQGVDLIGFHGQTLAHDPGGRGTLQVGSGAVLAEVLGKTVVWDFRTMDVELGGQGAPLAAFFHFACAKWIGATGPVVFLNLGGISNVTWVDPRCGEPTDAGALLAFDTGPANAPLNDMMAARLGKALDRDGVLAASGQVAEGVLEVFLDSAFFHKLPPKSLDRNDFNDLKVAVQELSDRDAAATLTAAVAASVVKGAEHFPRRPEKILVTGGGRRNPVMMAMLQAGFDCPVEPVEAVGLDGDMLEAQAFAYLAIRVLRGMATSCPATTGVAAAVGGGQISRPGR